MSNNTQSRLSIALLSTAALLLALALWLWSQQLNASWFSLWNGAGAHLPAAVWANLTLVADTLFAVAAILMVASYHPRLLGQSLLLLLLGGLFVHLIKQGLNVPRPPAVLDADSFRLIGPALKNESFPSGHAFTAMSAATLIALNLKHVTLSALVIIIGGLGGCQPCHGWRPLATGHSGRQRQRHSVRLVMCQTGVPLSLAATQ